MKMKWAFIITCCKVARGDSYSALPRHEALTLARGFTLKSDISKFKVRVTFGITTVQTNRNRDSYTVVG